MTNQQGAPEALAHELFTAAQLAPGEGISDAVARIAALVEAQQPAPSAAAEWLEHAFREGWSACRDAEFVGEEAEDWAFGNSQANSRMIDIQQAAPQPAPTPQADSQPAPDNLRALFREALAWGMTYGPEIPAHQWDEMRESMVEQYASRAARAPADSVTAPAGGEVAGPVSTVPLRELGVELRKVLYCLGGPQLWALHRNGSLIRYLDQFENDFVDSALAAVPTPPAQAADSVLEDAARLDWLDQQCEAYGFQDIHEGNRWEISGAYANVREAIDAESAARKQGANHD